MTDLSPVDHSSIFGPFRIHQLSTVHQAGQECLCKINNTSVHFLSLSLKAPHDHQAVHKHFE